jgi:hypothetical protein
MKIVIFWIKAQHSLIGGDHLENFILQKTVYIYLLFYCIIHDIISQAETVFSNKTSTQPCIEHIFKLRQGFEYLSSLFIPYIISECKQDFSDSHTSS